MLTVVIGVFPGCINTLGDKTRNSSGKPGGDKNRHTIRFAQQIEHSVGSVQPLIRCPGSS